MITVEDILVEVEAEASALNGEIVRRAYQRHCCDFVDNQGEFKGLLAYYIALRRQIHVLKRRYYSERSEARITRLNQEWSDMTRMAADARKRLKNHWPCAACIWLYNPTRRIRRFPSLI